MFLERRVMTSQKVSFFVLSLSVFSLLLFSSCKTDEPISSAAGNVQGVVKNALTGSSVRNARIITSPATVTVFTDSAGSFFITDIASGVYAVIASKDSLTPDTISVAVEGGRTVRADFELGRDYSFVQAIQYSLHIQPLFTRSCALSGCHSTISNAAGLSLASWDDLIKGSTHGEVLIPKLSIRSLLTLLFDGTSLRKQHPALTKSLTQSEINFLKRWIAEGAKNDAGQIPYEQAKNKVYVPNQGEDNVAIIDAENLVVYKYVNVGNSPAVEGPHFITANEHFWYVSLIGAGQVWKFDAHTDSVIGKATIPGAPALLALTPDGSKLYVSQFTTSSTNKIYVVNTQSMTVATQISVWSMPHGIRMNHAGTKVYAANMMSDNISVINVERDSVIATIPLAEDANPLGPPKYMPMEVAVSPDDNLVAVACSETQEVRIIDATRDSVVKVIHVGDQPWHVQFIPNGTYCYVTNRRENSVSAIHIPMMHVMETISTPVTPKYFDYPHGCDVSSDGRYTFISNENAGHNYIPRYNTDYIGNVCVIDNALNQVIKVLEVGRMPTGLSVQP
jgi:YVTN family beta-propeller protein